MTLEPFEIPELPHSSDDFSSSPSHSSQHGSFLYDSGDFYLGTYGGDGSGSDDRSERSGHGARRDSLGGINADVLDERLRGLRIRGLDNACAATPGQRVYEYENALSQRAPQKSTKRQTRENEHDYDGVELNDLPNEILTHIFSHLPPGSHSSVALVSKRFWLLITTHHAWRIAFMRHFPGHTALDSKIGEGEAGLRNESSFGKVRSETRYFPRLTLRATWRSEYLLRTRYLRSLARGKPGVPSDAATPPGGARSGKKLSAVLTYNSKLPWRVTSIHAIFSNGKKPPRVIQGTAELGMATLGDPTTGKIEKWGIEDLYAASQLEDAFTGLVPFGLGQGPAAAPNVMDVSQSYGMICGEGFPGGRAYFRGVNEARGRYLNTEAAVADSNPDIPRVPSGLDAICSVWIAKSFSVISTTVSMCGLLTGTALGVVTAYSLGGGTNGSRYACGEVTARWVLSPGVPIISLQVDDGYCPARKLAKRIWAVALNALGEVFYLNEAPVGKPVRTTGQDVMLNAWHAGRSVYWNLVGDTRRVARTSDLENDALLEGHCPRSSSSQMGVDQDQLVAETGEVNKFLNYKPERFRNSFEGWDMQRRLEVDFANDDGNGAGEGIFVVDCGLAKNRSARIRRHVRTGVSRQLVPSGAPLPITAPYTPSLFGAPADVVNQVPQAVEPQSPRSPPPTPLSPLLLATAHTWTHSALDLKNHSHCVISATALDNSVTSLATLSEDGMLNANAWADQATQEIPGRRARFLVAGTNDGLVLVWNARDENQKGTLQPIRIIQTDSPAITCVAASGLYVVHGGSDGLVQAWDPLSSDMEHVRTINARPKGRAPRQMMVMNPTLREADLMAVAAIYLDPDPTVLQGIVSFGAYLRTWSYSSSPGRSAGSKKHAHHGPNHAEADARLASRRQSSIFAGFIASEEAELQRENAQRERERLRLSKRFGALGDLTEEEAMVYAQMISEEEFHAEESKRASDSTLDAGVESASSSLSEVAFETVTPDPSPAAGPSAADTPARLRDQDDHGDDEYEQQIQQAIRLSLMENMHDDDHTCSPPPGEGGFTVKYQKPRRGGGKKDKQQRTASASLNNRHFATASRSAQHQYRWTSEDEDLDLALSLSMQDQERGQADAAADTGMGHHHHDDQRSQHEGFPGLPGDGAGKGKGVQR